MPKGSSIIFCASINPFVGHPELVDYTATKGAMIGFMRALSNQVVGDKGIRVNGRSLPYLGHPSLLLFLSSAVAPGPIWTPLMWVFLFLSLFPCWCPIYSPSTMTDDSKKTFGTTTPIGRPGQPVEVATCFVFLASSDSSYIRYFATILMYNRFWPLLYPSGQVLHPNGGVVVN